MLCCGYSAASKLGTSVGCHCNTLVCQAVVLLSNVRSTACVLQLQPGHKLPVFDMQTLLEAVCKLTPAPHKTPQHTIVASCSISKPEPKAHSTSSNYLSTWPVPGQPRQLLTFPPQMKCNDAENLPCYHQYIKASLTPTCTPNNPPSNRPLCRHQLYVPNHPDAAAADTTARSR